MDFLLDLYLLRYFLVVFFFYMLYLERKKLVFLNRDVSEIKLFDGFFIERVLW